MSLFLHFFAATCSRSAPSWAQPAPARPGRAARRAGSRSPDDKVSTTNKNQTNNRQVLSKMQKNCKLPQGPFRRGWPQLPWRRERNERAAGTSPSPCWWQQKMNKDEKLDILTFVGPSQWSAWKHLEEAPEIKRLCWKKTFLGNFTLLANSTNHHLMALWFGSPFVEFSVLQMLWISGLTPSGMSRKGSLLGNLFDKSIFAKLSF